MLITCTTSEPELKYLPPTHHRKHEPKNTCVNLLDHFFLTQDLRQHQQALSLFTETVVIIRFTLPVPSSLPFTPLQYQYNNRTRLVEESLLSSPALLSDDHSYWSDGTTALVLEVIASFFVTFVATRFLLSMTTNTSTTTRPRTLRRRRQQGPSLFHSVFSSTSNQQSTGIADKKRRPYPGMSQSDKDPLLGRHPDFYSHGDDTPGRTLFNTWFFGIMIPAFVGAWSVTDGNWVAVLVATLATPILAIAQGSLGILKFRVHFGDAPLPQTPSHGVVVVNPKDKVPVNRTNETQSNNDEASPSTRPQTPRPSTSQHEQLLREAVQHPPVRLLVIGDSLAIGVGQSNSSTPILPETIAKTLSKRLGRVVYWTCHGAPGASTGWVVRELERGVGGPVMNTRQGQSSENDNDIVDSSNEEEDDDDRQCSYCSDTDESTTDGSSTSFPSSALSREGVADSRPKGVAVGVDDYHLGVWKERLEYHKQRFNPDMLGPYDIVVVLTGSNDLKSTFFPFLLTGEDAEFRRQAKERGGDYSNELRRLLVTLNWKMRRQLLTFRTNVLESVEAATERVREQVEETMERIVPGSSSKLNKRIRFSSTDEEEDLVDEDGAEKDEKEDLTPEMRTNTIQRSNSRQFPLVVLPAMPARALPVFRIVPLRWLSIPIVDIMDMHKRNLARCHPGEVQFVPAPSLYDLAMYEREDGEIWEQRCLEETILSLKDIRKRDRRRIEQEMQEYFNIKGLRNRASVGIFSRFRKPAPAESVFSADQIHPNDRGYDFWGRYIAGAIVNEWHEKKHQ